MTKEELEEIKLKLSKLNVEERKNMDLYLRKLSLGEIQGTLVGYPSIDKPWLKFYSEELINGDIEQKRVIDVIYDKNKENLDDIALIYFGSQITYRELFEHIDATAKAFSSIGISEGDTVSVIMPSLPETIYAFYALNRIGAIANMIDPRYNPEKIKKLINETSSKTILVVSVSYDKIMQIKDDISVKNIISISPSESMQPIMKFIVNTKDMIDRLGQRLKGQKINYVNWSYFIQNGKNSTVIDCKYNPDSPVAIVYTGGTTGSSKGAVMTTYALNALIYHQRSCMPLVERQSKYLDIMPPFIAFGLTCGMNNPLAEGAKLDLIPTFDHHKFDSLIMKHKPNHVIGVPSFWEDLANSQKASSKDFSYLQSVIAGGDSISPEAENKVNKFLNEHGCSQKLLKGYGMTEVCSCAAFTCTPESNKIGSVGIPLAKDVFKIVNPDNGEELMYNEQGEIYILAPSTMKGYLNNDLETQKVLVQDEFGNTWVKTGDLGYIDNDGCVYIVDRIKNMIVRPDGFKVFPITIEQYILKHKAVSACKVIGVEQKGFIKGQFPIAYIVLKDEVDYSDEILHEISKICSLNLPEYQIPIDYRFIDELPLTSIGKIDTQKLYNMYTGNEIKKLIKK